MHYGLKYLTVKKRKQFGKIFFLYNLNLIVTQALAVRQQLIINLYRKIKSFNNKYVDKFNTNTSTNELKIVYGGLQQHAISTDYKKEKLFFTYQSKEDTNNNSFGNHNTSLPALNSSMQYHLDPLSSSLNLLATNLNQKFKYRNCDSNCNLPDNWPKYLFNCFKILQPTYYLNLLQSNIIQFEKCMFCYENNSRCKDRICQDNIAYINNLSKHFIHLRTIKRQLYIIRDFNIQIINLDQILNKSSLNDLIEFISFKKDFEKIKLVDMNIKRISYFDIKKYENYLNEYKKELKSRLNYNECAICHKLLSRSKLKIISNDQLKNDFVKQIITYEPIIDQYICIDQCFNDIFKNNTIPKYSKLNNMEIQTTPQQLQNLNFFEKTLIHRAKCFLSTVKLKTISKKRNGVKALKGLAIHLPISFESTNEYIATTLPNPDALNIIIYGLPTATNNIWRNLVDLDKVYDAIHWLAIHNNYYHTDKVNINYTYKNNKNALLCIDREIENNNTKAMINEQAPYLTKFQNQAFNHYTVIDLDKLNLNNTDIEKYAMKKVVAEPIKDRNKDLDHLCFVDIFPTGKGGMYDDRPIEVKPAMYMRWIIMNKNPVARRNIQYIFHLLHNKDIRAADSGIYASLRTSKMQNITAKNMINHIKNDSKELEANLSTTLSAVRGSREYWSRIRSDLKACETVWGPAGVFFTISCNEWEWLDLLEFIKYMNSDISNINDLNFDQLINLDPVSVSIFYENKAKAFFSKLLLNKNGPFGEIIHYFYRTEYQQRGAPHIHGILWIKDCPIFGEAPDSVVLKWIEEHITCRMPDPEKEPLLYEKVKKYQVHHDNSSCQRLVNGANKKKGIICRYGFPRTSIPFSKLNTVEQVLASKVRGNKPIKIYSLQRSVDEVWINDYNEYMLLIWDGNVDVQYIGIKSFSLHKYITDYISKSEHNYTQEIWDECNNNKTIRGSYF